MNRRKVWGIEREVLEMISQASRQAHPYEFVATMRAEDGVICELLLLPGSISSGSSATFPTFNLPIDLSIVGSVHSHPSYSNEPSEADLHLFSSYGNTHIIICMPYDMTSWRSYDRQGRPVDLQVL
ncbi:MAG TPA: Mov34/MPN/PAD-1 family protein [Methanomassiliicoccaceae archaeon]|jgi:proteasome lid subunit RPN8/RPN11|nr:Mov34/MPN/PAD-1 family protein [Methanomassiliicoccaceae archaeon]HOL06901.1 Mov34/MPN/PAD-1 family protein [Methanomassiliicoccaceae archaeon]